MKVIIAFSILAALFSTRAAAMPVSEQQTIAISYVAGVDENAVPALEKYFFEKTFDWTCHTPGTIACFISGPDDFPHRTDIARLTIAKNNFWMPFIIAQMQNQYGQSNVILDPLIIKLGENNHIIVTSDLDDNVVDQRVYFSTWSDVTLNRLGAPGGYTTKGGLIFYVAKQIPDHLFLGQEAAFDAVFAVISSPKLKISSASAKGAVWDKMISDGSAAMPQPPLVKIGTSISKLFVQREASPCTSNYGALLSLPPSLNEEICQKLRDAELRFRIQRSATLVQYLRDSAYGKSLRDMAVAEKNAQNQENAAAYMLLAGGLSQTALSMSQGIPMSQISSKTFQQGIRVEAQLNERLASDTRNAGAIISLQTSVGTSEIGQTSEISASSISELRTKLAAIGKRSNR